MNFGSGGNSSAKAWRDIWGSGQGISAIEKVVTVADLVKRLTLEYEQKLQSFHNPLTDSG
jgi:nitronate monooxygenase